MGEFIGDFWASWIEATGGTVAFVVAAYLYFSGKSALGSGALVVVGLVCFFLASYNAWNKQHLMLVDVRSELLNVKSKPSFKGHIFQMNLLPRTGIVQPEMMQEIINGVMTMKNLPPREYRCDCDIFIEAYIFNENVGVTGVINLTLTVRVLGEERLIHLEPSFDGWVLERRQMQIDPISGFATEKTDWAQIPRLDWIMTSPPLMQGHGKEGWLHFLLKDVGVVNLGKDLTGLSVMRLTVIDSYGSEHPIEKSWNGPPRMATVGKDVQRAT